LTRRYYSEKQLRIDPQDRNIRLKFGLLDYETKHITYAYKIEGADEHWQYTQDPVIHLDRLFYGSYTIRLRTEDASQELKIPLKVIAPFYLQSWFLVSSILLFILLVFRLIRWRTRASHQRQKVLEQAVLESTTELREKTQQLEVQAEDLKALDQLKSRFFANISHELRTPLTLILGPLSQLKKEADLKATVKRKLGTIERNGTKLLKLVEEILDLSKMDANKLELHEQATPLKAFTARIFSTFESQADFKKINYQLELDVADDLQVLLDRDKVEKILNNLIANALKFTAAGGTIKVQLKYVENLIQFGVADTGRGISPEEQAHVFDRFYQSKEQTSQGGGTGIGLAFCKELAELMNGQIGLKSELEKGSTFSLELLAKPLRIPAHIKLAVEIPPQQILAHEEMILLSGNNTSATILLVEDNRDMQIYVQELLEGHYQIITCNDGQMAYDYLLDENNALPDLMVSDVMMPQMDGFTLLDHCKSLDRLRNMPVIMLTARSATSDKLNALTLGVDDYLTKPFVVEELLVRIKNLLHHAQVRKSAYEGSVTALANPLELVASKAPIISELDQQWIKKIEAMLQENVEDSNFDVDAFADVVQIGRRSLYRRLKQLTGLTPAQYIKEVRLQLARNLLERGVYKTMSEVAYAAGFTTPDYFSKIFEKRFGRKATSYF
ncbi:MAG: ATP-binding protein, partial [Bacteroidota bacterium]